MRLVTRSDFDGLACAVLLKEKGVIGEYKFSHPKDLQDGIVEVTANDVLANVPYVKGCGMWFDHHTSEYERLGKELEVPGDSRPLKSCARVIWEYYGGYESFSSRFDSMMEAVDKVDSGQLSENDILNPEGWVMLGFIMDPRTGLGRYRDYRVSNYKLMEHLIEYCRSMDVHEILELYDVKERLDVYNKDLEPFKQMIRQNSKVYGRLLVTDLREQNVIYAGNRFMPYTLYPECNLSMQIMWGMRRQNTVVTAGYSILNRTCKVDVGSLMLKYGGGGHPQVGTCQIPNEGAEEKIAEIIEAIVKANS
ncbi:MAG: exopolyphosphatase [Desulfovibrionaceae bacterium]|nr:exopolyphosphatase [Desulfovibrionaceae bacterium]